MTEDRRIEDAGRMARMEANISHLAKSFDEFKDETKEFHKEQTKMLNELSEKWLAYGGLSQGVLTIQKQVNENTAQIEKIERWRIAFVAKWGVYMGLVGFGGGILTQLLIWYLTK